MAIIKLNHKAILPRYNKMAVDVKSAIYFQPNLIDDITDVAETRFFDGREVKFIRHTRDVDLLLHQEKLSMLDKQFINDYFEARADNQQMQELRKNVSDEQLLSMCKSRYLQRPAEIDSYMNYLEANWADEIAQLETKQVESEAPKDSAADNNVNV